MTNREAINALKDIQTYAQSVSLNAVEYAINVLEKLEKEGIANPLGENFAKAGENDK